MSHDSELQKAVTAELGWEPSVIAAHIGVTANAGIVTLTGHVSSYAEKHAAEVATGRVKGVRAVAGELEVRLPFETKRTDEEIAAAAVERLSWDVSVPRDAVQVRVDKGWITLSGEVDFHFQKRLAEENVRRLIGVTGVTDQVAIRPRVDASGLSEDITHALHRSWVLDPKTVTVTAEGGRVHLTGTVQTYHDRQIAADTAWAAQGVTDVENDLSIN